MNTTMAHETSALLVTGASGHLGRRVAELLLASEAARERGLIVTTRTPDAVADLAARGAMVRRADFEDDASLEAAFRGVQRALIVSTDALDRPGRRIAQHRAAVAAARAAGVRHLLYTSLTNPGPESLVTLAPDHDATERAILAAGLGYTILRNNLYTEYLLPGLVRALKVGALRNSYGAGAVAYVTREDCARAAAAALLSTFDGRAVLDISGPNAVTQRELVAIASEVANRSLTYVPIDAAAAKRALIERGLPEAASELIVSFERAGAQGQLAVTSSAVQDLTGAAPASVRDFLLAQRAVLAA